MNKFISYFNTKNKGLSRTNNVSEGWNHAFAPMANTGKRSIYDFIGSIKKEQNLVASKIANCLAGLEPPPLKKEFVEREANIRRVLKDFDEAMKDYEDDLFTDDEDENDFEDDDAENDSNAMNSPLSQNWVDAREDAISQHPALILINAIAHHDFFDLLCSGHLKKQLFLKPVISVTQTIS